MLTPLVLLVDANDDSRAIYATILAHGGFSVALASQAREGLSEARASPPDLVVLAVTAPRGMSLHMVRAFRDDPATARVPLLALSTVPADHERDLLLAEGVTDYMPKPCTPLELLAAVRRILER